jgi:AcrR family transcriptional regulator
VNTALRTPKARRPYTPRMPTEARRDQLLDAALEIIARDGYRAVSIEAIARAVGVTRPVIYNIFDGLDELLYALLDRQEGRALDQLSATISLQPDVTDLSGFLTRAIADLIAMVSADPHTWRLIFLASGGTPAAVRKRVDHDREVVRGRIGTAVSLAIDAGALAPGIDADVVSHALIALGEYFGRLLLESPASVNPQRLANTVSALLGGRRSPPA